MNFCRFLISKEKRIMASLESLKFENLVLSRLPIDTEERNYVRSVTGACFSRVLPTPVKNPTTVAYSKSAMALLDLHDSQLERKEFAKYFSGNKLLPGSETAAHCYCGHQFGHFSGQLGDGAAMYLGEVINNKGERWEIQLKGAGLTPYSRTADGRKVLRSSIREFLCSEAMHFLGIPTTRAGSCVTSDSTVVRDIFYDGHPIEEKCTIVLRIAPTFLRFGSFEIFKTRDQITGRSGPSVGHYEILHTLLNYTIETFYSEVHERYKDKSAESKYAAFFKEIVLRTARMVALWQCFGFCHGVLNTDNMSIVGLTIDYGPFGFMDMYNPDHICNGSDDNGRYSYKRQPEICLWNLKKLAEAIEKALPLSVSIPLLDLYEPEFNSCYLAKMRQKLGLIQKKLDTDDELLQNLLDTMESTGADFSNTFRCLALLELPGLPDHEASREKLILTLLKQCYPLPVLIKARKSGMESRNMQMLLLLSQTNPAFAERLETSGVNLNQILSNIEKVSKLEKLSPDEKKVEDTELWKKWLRAYCDRLKLEVDNINDIQALKLLQEKRIRVMNNSNPKFILRNYILQSAIEKAEAGNYDGVKQLLKKLEKPFEEDISAQDEQPCSTKTLKTEKKSSRSSFVEKFAVDELPPDSAFDLKVT